MTALLISVRDAAEAQDAFAAGADLIDIKEPKAGSLGAATPETIAEIVRVVAGRRPVSVALGELATGLIDLHELDLEIQFAKVGLAGCAQQRSWSADWQSALSELPSSAKPVAVVYADCERAVSPSPFEIIDHGQRLGCRVMLVDTFDKRGPGLLGLWTLAELKRTIAAARAAEMLIVIGGQIIDRDLPALLPLLPDYIAVRGAVCRNGRTAHLDPARVRQFKDWICSAPRNGSKSKLTT
jgi:(5-formylfuran-3-yl)methyl phosphate synthase